jgi:hypothetical protein
MKYARPLIENETVRVHKNLNNGKWTIRARVHGKGFQVMAHVDNVTILNPTPKVSIPGVARIISNQVRAVVACIEGTYCTKAGTYGLMEHVDVRYNPYRNSQFTTTNGIFKAAKVAVFEANNPHFTI